MNRRWLCNDVWMDILPLFDRPQLGFKLAMLSPRFDALVDTHFDGKTELTLWRPIAIRNSVAAVPELHVFTDGANNYVPFPLPDVHSPPMPNNIRFKDLRINYIDHAVIAFLRANKQIFNKGTKLRLSVPFGPFNNDAQSIWDDFACQIWPIFAPTIRHFGFPDGHLLHTLLRLVSPTILIDDQINIHSINSGRQFPEAIGNDHFDGPTEATFDRTTTNYDGSIVTSVAAGQALSKWLHISRKDGQPKQLRFRNFAISPNIEWQNNFKEKFLRANTSVSYKIYFETAASFEPFELVNERTQEKLTLIFASETIWAKRWIMKRCPIGEAAAAAIHWEDENLDDNLNNVNFWHSPGGFTCLGCGLTETSFEEAAGQSSDNGASSEEEEAGQNSDNGASSEEEEAGQSSENGASSEEEEAGQSSENGASSEEEAGQNSDKGSSSKVEAGQSSDNGASSEEEAGQNSENVTSSKEEAGQSSDNGGVF
ncbi:hypothetical protein niasHT_019811 [Heterodera trifolii]|uniref:F-box domain-containing protein n=1 Tax=Heterodera trifolii TaxID=157864 RepID=A0ABD2KUU3_9BILA